MILRGLHIAVTLADHPIHLQQAIGNRDSCHIHAVLVVLFFDRSVHSLDPDGIHRKGLVSGHICDNICIIGDSVDEIIVDKSKGFDLLSFRRRQLHGFLRFQTHHHNLRSLIGAFRGHPRYVRLTLRNHETVLRDSVLDHLAASVAEFHLVQRAVQIQVHLVIGAYIRQDIQILAQNLIRNRRRDKQFFLCHLALRVEVIHRHTCFSLMFSTVHISINHKGKIP